MLASCPGIAPLRNGHQHQGCPSQMQSPLQTPSTCTTKQYLRFEATTMSFRSILKPLINGEQKWQKQSSSLRKPRCRLLLTSWLSATRIMLCFAHLCPYLIPITPLTRVDGATFMANSWNSPSLSLSPARAHLPSRGIWPTWCNASRASAIHFLTTTPSSAFAPRGRIYCQETDFSLSSLT